MEHILFSAPKTVPENVTARATGNSTIHVEWSSADISSNVGFEGFSVEYKAEGHPERSGENKTDRHTNEITLKRLRMFTKYTIRVAARTTQNGNFSKGVNATTWEGGKNTQKKLYGQRNIPFLSHLVVPLFRKESSYKTFHMKISFICMEINL